MRGRLVLGSILTMALVIIFFVANPVPNASTASDNPPVVSTTGQKLTIVTDGKPNPYKVPPPESFIRKTVSPQFTNASFTVNYTGFSAEAQAAFQYAVDIWASQISSSVPIVVNASWSTLQSCTIYQACILGQAGPNTLRRDFSGVPLANTWYHIALANKIYGSDIDPVNSDINAQFNSGYPSWYYGTDGNTPYNKIDFVSVVLHELGHGLGFSGSMSYNAGVGSYGYGTSYPSIYDRYTVNGSNQSLISFPNSSTQLGSQLVSNDIYFDSPTVRNINSGNKAKLYSPASWQGGSSYSHLDEIYNNSSNALMTYSIGGGEVVHSPGPIVLAMFKDMGWTVNYNWVPAITSISPTSISTGSNGFTLTVNGSNFVNGSVVRWNGSDRVTNFVSSSQLTAQILTGDLTSPGTIAVNVFNPTPGGGQSGGAQFTISNGVPAISSISPVSAIAGGVGFTLTITGTNFFNGSVVRWNGSDRTTSLVSSTKLTATINAADIATAGTANVTVFNPSPGGGTSSSSQFTVNNPTPAISSLSPTSVNAGSNGLTLTVNGSNFVNSSVVRWNGVDRVTSFVSSSQLQATILAADLLSPATVSITVFNPTPGGGLSSGQNFQINNSTPVITSFSPPGATAGDGSFTLTINGSNFIQNTPQVQWNGSPRTTVYINSHQLLAYITAADILSSGNATVTVINQAVSGDTSGSNTFNISSTCLDLVVSSKSDNVNNCGTLRYALTKVSGNNTVISFALPTNPASEITLNNGINVASGITLQGICTPNGPGVVLKGPGSGSGIVLSGNNNLFGLKITGFDGPQLLIPGNPKSTPNQLKCVTVSKN